MLTSFDFSHVRALNTSQGSQLFLSDSLLHARSTHCFPESLGWFGFISGCTWRTASSNNTLLHE